MSRGGGVSLPVHTEERIPFATKQRAQPLFLNCHVCTILKPLLSVVKDDLPALSNC